MAIIGNFSGAILENEKKEQFFVIEGDEINLENQIFTIENTFQTLKKYFYNYFLVLLVSLFYL